MSTWLRRSQKAVFDFKATEVLSFERFSVTASYSHRLQFATYFGSFRYLPQEGGQLEPFGDEGTAHCSVMRIRLIS